MKSVFRYTCLSLLIVVMPSTVPLAAQPEPGPRVREILTQVEKGIVESNIPLFSRYLGSQVAISMRSDWGGLYSANQSISILKNFFGMRRTIGFQFTTIQESPSGAFGTGGGNFLLRGTRENLQIYVRLTQIENKWTITQINIY